MLQLGLAILCSSSIAWLFKISEGTKSGEMNRYRVTAVNYFVAFTVSLIMYIMQKSSSNVVEKCGVIDWITILSIGIPAGFCFFLSFLYYQISVKENGASLSGMFGKLGILVPMIIAVVLWNEIPSLTQAVGIAMAIFAMVLVNLPKEKSEFKGIKKSLILLFTFGGLAEFSSKLFQKSGNLEDKSIFLCVVFGIAFCLSAMMVKRSPEVKGSYFLKDALMGAAVGIPNLLSSVFLISALNIIPATIAFPIYSAASIGLISIGSRIFFKEELSQKAWVGIIVTMFALVLVNI